MCRLHNSINDLFHRRYEGLKSDFWQLIPRWSGGLVVWLMIHGLGFDYPHNLIKKNDRFSKWEKIRKKNKVQKGVRKKISRPGRRQD